MENHAFGTVEFVNTKENSSGFRDVIFQTIPEVCDEEINRESIIYFPASSGKISFLTPFLSRPHFSDRNEDDWSCS